LSGGPGFREVLRRVREVVLDAHSHQDLPFERLLEELQPKRDLSRTPIFQVFLNMLNFSQSDVELAGLTAETLTNDEVSSNFDFTLYVAEARDEIRFDLVYNADLFSPERMAEMLRQFEHLLSQIVESPAESIARFSLLTEEARVILPNPAEPLSDEWRGGVHTLFSAHAQEARDRIAVSSAQGSWTYRELDARSNQLANYLRATGIKSEDIVAIYAHRNSSLVWAIMGALKAGAAFLILDPAYPAMRLIDYLDIANPKGWIQIEGAAVLPDELSAFVEEMPFICRLELPRKTSAGFESMLSEWPADMPSVTVGPDSLACISFTSGSTGRPKAILGRHGPLSHFLPWQRENFGLRETDRYSMLSGLSHDPLQRDIFTPLSLGGTVCIPDLDNMVVSGSLAQWMRREMISIAHLTPAMAQLITQVLFEPDADRVEIPSLRYAFIVGDALTKRDVARLRKVAPSITCVNFYGSTETQRAVGYFVVPEQDYADADDSSSKTVSRSVIPLGRGMKDVQLLVLSRPGQLAGIGEAGEIYIRSPHLARSYLHNDDLSQQRFLPNPFTKATGDRLYRTGDLGSYLPDGNVGFLGRADHQVKIRGYRIELGEIESVLGRHPAIREAVVVARDDEKGEKRLIGYLVCASGNAPAASELRSYLKQRLPESMVPSIYVTLDALPLTPNGKVDRKRLPEPDWKRSKCEEGWQAPRTIVEQRVAEIWSEVLGVERVGVEDNFFELGGHSLLATQVISRVRDAFGVEVPLLRLFQTPTVAGLAEIVGQVDIEQDDDDILEMLEMVEKLSDDQVKSELGKRIQLKPVEIT